MGRVFLGRPFHWLLVAALIALGWLAGRARLHVTDFNLFMAGTLVVTAGVLLLVLWSSPPGAEVTRDPLAEPGDEGEGD